MEQREFTLSSVGLNTQFEYFYKDHSRVQKFYDGNKLGANIERCVKKDGLSVLNYAYNHFLTNPPNSKVSGITAFAVLNYSDMNIHTSEEYGSIAGRIYSCKRHDSGIIAEKAFRQIYLPDLVVLQRNIVVIDPQYNPRKDKRIKSNMFSSRGVIYDGRSRFFNMNQPDELSKFEKTLLSAKRDVLGL